MMDTVTMSNTGDEWADLADDADRAHWAEDQARESERERIASAVEAQIRHLLAVPADVTTVPREAMVADLRNLADEIRGGRYST